MRFVLADDRGRPIRLGEALDNQSVELTPDSLEFSNSELSVVDGPSVQFVADIDEHQVFGLLMENAGSLDGFIPPGTNAYWDRNGNGTTGDPDDSEPPNPRYTGTATDFNARREAALFGAFTKWERASEVAQAEGRDTYFGLWSFESSSLKPTSYVGQPSSTGSAWSDQAQAIKRAIREDYNEANAARDTRANVYESITTLIGEQYSESTMAGLVADGTGRVDKQLVVFVDGPDDMRESDGVTIDDVINAAKEEGVRVFVVHLDPALEDPEHLREDPMYPEGQAPCSDDSECKNYEACRKPRGYTEDVGDTVESPGTYDIDQTYCLPERDADGRVGPIHDYSRLACETGGGYIYAPSSAQLQHDMQWLPLALDGLWEARVNLAALSRGDAASGQAHKVQTELTVDVVGTTRNYWFYEHTDANPEFDTRGVVFAK